MCCVNTPMRPHDQHFQLCTWCTRSVDSKPHPICFSPNNDFEACCECADFQRRSCQNDPRTSDSTYEQSPSGDWRSVSGHAELLYAASRVPAFLFQSSRVFVEPSPIPSRPDGRNAGWELFHHSRESQSFPIQHPLRCPDR